MNTNSNNFSDSIVQSISKFVRQATSFDDFRDNAKKDKVLVRD